MAVSLYVNGSEAAQDNAQTMRSRTAHHGRSASGAAVPICNQGIAMRSHSRIAERASGSTIQPPLRREDAQCKPTLMRIAHS